MQFNDTSNLTGLIQECERICLLGTAGITGVTNQLKNFTVRLNMALDRFFTIALTHDGVWQFDDTNYTDLPIGTTNLVSGQQDYSFASDVISVEKVLCKDSAGNWVELYPVDDSESRSNIGARNIWLLPSNNSGTPLRYDKFAASIFLDPIPNYNSTNGLKVVFKRNASKFVSSDTTKEPGIPSLFHPYLAKVASLPYLMEHNMEALETIKKEIGSSINGDPYYGGDELKIVNFMSRRNMDDKPIFKPKFRSAR